MFVSKVFFCLLVAGYEVVRNQKTRNFKEPLPGNVKRMVTAWQERAAAAAEARRGNEPLKPQLETLGAPPPALDAGVDAEVRCAEKDAQVRGLEAQLKKAGDKLDEQKKLQKEAEYQYSIAVDRTECTRGARVKATRAVLMTGGGAGGIGIPG